MKSFFCSRSAIVCRFPVNLQFCEIVSSWISFLFTSSLRRRNRGLMGLMHSLSVNLRQTMPNAAVHHRGMRSCGSRRSEEVQAMSRWSASSEMREERNRWVIDRFIRLRCTTPILDLIWINFASTHCIINADRFHSYQKFRRREKLTRNRKLHLMCRLRDRWLFVTLFLH